VAGKRQSFVTRLERTRDGHDAALVLGRIRSSLFFLCFHAHGESSDVLQAKPQRCSSSVHQVCEALNEKKTSSRLRRLRISRSQTREIKMLARCNRSNVEGIKWGKIRL
jgi:GTP cyclohydrolase II